MKPHYPNSSSWTSCDQLSAEDESRSATGHWVHVLISEFMDSGGHAHSALSPCLIWDSIEVFSWRCSSCSSGWRSRCVIVVVLMLQSWVCADSLRQHTLSSEVELSISLSQRQHNTPNNTTTSSSSEIFTDFYRTDRHSLVFVTDSGGSVSTSGF